MKKFFALMIACSFAVMSANAKTSDAAPDASPEAQPAEAAVAAPEPAPAPAVVVDNGIEVPQAITDHLGLRFPGHEVQGVVREGHTYVVDLGNGLHIRYDNCCNPVCYGVHTHNHD